MTLLVAASPTGALAQATTPDAPLPCAAPEARQFDFFLGDWQIDQTIRTAAGTYETYPARTSVRLAAGGCALVEDWIGTVRFFWAGMTEPAELRGLSVRAWNPAAARWEIYWLDTMQPQFGEPFTGTFAGGRGVFTRRSRAPDGTPQTVRITFEQPADGVVEWSLEVTGAAGGTWQRLWTMRMVRRTGG